MSPDPFIIREAQLADAARLMDFGNRLLAESDFYMRSPGERANDLGQMQMIIRSFNETANHVMLHAWDGDEPVGEAVLVGGTLRKTRHGGMVGLGVLKSHQGRGLGRRLMEALEMRAREIGLHRLELTVLHTNPVARRMYTGLGYRREGVKRHSVRQGDRYVDEILMAKLLP